jgi:hypothetical protein
MPLLIRPANSHLMAIETVDPDLIEGGFGLLVLEEGEDALLADVYLAGGSAGDGAVVVIERLPALPTAILQRS